MDIQTLSDQMFGDGGPKVQKYLAASTEAEAEGFYRYLNTQYYAHTPVLSDDEYEMCLVHFQTLISPANPIWDETFEVVGEEVPHDPPMLSTDKIYPHIGDGTNELRVWLAKCMEYGNPIIEVLPKYDGIAARIYRTGVTATRAKKHTGSNITHRMGNVGNAQVTTDRDRTGELIIPTSLFRSHFPNSEEGTIRNVVAGAMKPNANSAGPTSTRMLGIIEFVEFDAAPRIAIARADQFLACGSEKLMARVDRWFEYLGKMDYITDGLVLQVQDPEIQDRMGSPTGKYWGWQVALKKRGEASTSTIREITIQVGRTGRLNPVVHVDPILLSGAQVSKATGHSRQTMEDMGVAVGRQVKMVRSGDVIPYIISVSGEATEDPPSMAQCPSCGSDTVEAGSYTECPSLQCPAQYGRKISHFTDCIGADHFGDAIIDDMVSKGLIDDPLDLVRLSFTTDYLITGGISVGLAKRLVGEMDRVKKTALPESEILRGMGIRYLGNTMSKELLSHFSPQELVHASINQLEDIEGMGEKTARSIARDLLQRDWEFLALLGWFPNATRTTTLSEKSQMGTFVAGKQIVFTGTMASKNRKVMSKEAEDRGAVIKGSVSAKVDILVYGEKAGSKLAKANALREKGNPILILTEEEYNQQGGWS